MEREISDEEEEEEQEEFFYEYQTDEDEIIDEYDKDYINYQEKMEAAAADPYGDSNIDVAPIKQGAGKQFDQLIQEDEILSGENAKKL